MYEEGFGVEKSPEMAFFWHKEAAKNGNLSSQDMLGWMHENGCGTPQDKEEAFRCYEIAANRGEKHSQMSLVLMYEMGEGVQKNPEKAATWCRKLAEAEDPAAQFKLSVFFKDGFGVPVNKREAFKWCERSANKGGQNAIALLRWMYFSGYVVAPSDENEAILFHKKALHIYRRAAEDGDERGILKLASMFAKGEGIGKNIGKAIELYENSAVKKNPDVCVALGTLYTEIKDEENANKWFQEASNNK
jgi:TPR repeat protein